jgi:hypothetical protein
MHLHYRTYVHCIQTSLWSWSEQLLEHLQIVCSIAKSQASRSTATFSVATRLMGHPVDITSEFLRSCISRVTITTTAPSSPERAASVAAESNSKPKSESLIFKMLHIKTYFDFLLFGPFYRISYFLENLDMEPQAYGHLGGVGSCLKLAPVQ